jgi:hypothetical protein
MPRTKSIALLALGALAAACSALVHAASHREAPVMASDPTADITDVYAFVSYDRDNVARSRSDPERRVTLIMNVNPGQDPADGPNYFNFGDDVLYRIHVDNNRSGKAEDVVYEFRFKTENRPIAALGGLTSPVPLLGNPHISVAGPLLQKISSLDGPGSEGLTRRQTYTVHEIRHGERHQLFAGQRLIAVPSNVGPATMPDYGALAAEGTYTDADTGIRVFAGPRAETFYIDLGATFDTLNFRRRLPALSAAEDQDNVNPFGINRFSGANVSTIAIEVPTHRLTRDGKAAASTADPVIGVYASTSRQKVRVLRESAEAVSSGPWVQVSRMANPLVNELIITTPSKDLWNAQEPEKEAQFQAFYQKPVIAAELELVFGVPVVPIVAPVNGNRVDLMSILLKYPGQPLNGSACGSPCSELLRLNLNTNASSAETQKRLGSVLGGDTAGWPNGRRPNDDVTDIAVRVVGGKNYIDNRIGDGVNFLEGAPGAGGPDVTATGIARAFPFLPQPYDGKNRRHLDCDEPGVNLCGALVP